MPAHGNLLPFPGVTGVAVVFALPQCIRSCFLGGFANGLFSGRAGVWPLQPWGGPIHTPPSHINTGAEKTVMIW